MDAFDFSTLLVYCCEQDCAANDCAAKGNTSNGEREREREVMVFKEYLHVEPDTEAIDVDELSHATQAVDVDAGAYAAKGDDEGEEELDLECVVVKKK